MVRAALVLTMVVMAGGETRQCSNSEMERLWSSMVSPATVCQPRLVTEALPVVPGHSLVAPTHISVRKCGGSCSHSHSLHSCLPSKVSSREVEVVLSPVTVQAGVQQTVCGRVTVEQHDLCQCGCQVGPGDCTDLQTFLPLQCRCACSNRQDRLNCLAQARHWDTNLCLCLCPGRPYPTCPNGFIYDYLETCACRPTQQSAFSELEFVFVVVVVSFICGLTSLVQCYRRKIGLFRQVRSSTKDDIFHTLNNSFDQAVARNKAGMESLKTVEEEDIELLSIKKDDI